MIRTTKSNPDTNRKLKSNSYTYAYNSTCRNNYFSERRRKENANPKFHR